MSSPPPSDDHEHDDIPCQQPEQEIHTESGTESPPPFQQQPPARKLCVRHQRMADEGTNLKLQQSLDALPLEDRSAVSAIWSNFSSSSHPRRALILQGLLTMCCFSQLSLLTEQLAHLIRIDPFTVLPREVSLKVLSYLDATSLCRAAQVTKHWRSLADDDVLWRGICEQHIGQKCRKCGWALPILEKKRTFAKALTPPPSVPLSSSEQKAKRTLEDLADISERPLKRSRSDDGSDSSTSGDESAYALLAPLAPVPTTQVTRPWKDVYSERMTIEQNWRRGRCTVRTLRGHKDGVMCLQFMETLSHPAFPVLITGSYDRTARVWNLETGVELHCLKGHTRAIRALQFDEVKLITGSMDSTLKVWDWRRGRLIRTLTGHTEGVVCLNFDSNVLASGSVDSTIKVWNLRTGGAFTLRGHSDWVNAVRLWDSNTSSTPSTTMKSPMFDTPGCAAPQIDPGKMLFSGSDDGTIRLWDLTQRACLKIFTGHVGQVQSLKLLFADDCSGEEVEGDQAKDEQNEEAPQSQTRAKKPILISGSLDNTVKQWDIDTGKTVRTFFGHIEGVWAVASDKMRLVSGSHDRTIKVWSREDGSCTATLVGHTAAVSCLALGEDKIISGGDDNDVKVWSFSE
ncbi:F-box/WD repeat-containing protein pof1 [Desarmillaria tabescens]|uniref:F-box/WD repeat-containing protein pof1 n=1 Tax=Armillaria tabescens TaxID=1929756 RepID=A0AA39N6B8_ARMTA|nr:F-box/WD repeat-containing protein pof1 [Desarmillaria tabescens]KAK0459497.1 F-box/WD repeat-containing protein pof1 [Desarmillaria tabescens]